MSSETTLSKRPSFLYRLTIWVSAFLFHTFFPVRYHYETGSKPEAPYILIGNHLSMWDPLILGYGDIRHRVRFLGKSELVQKPLLRWMFNQLHMIAVRRYNTDMQALRACLKVLKDGEVLGIFPEGTRHRETMMEELEGGVAMIALRSDVPILPVFIVGKPKPFHPAMCYFGTPFTVSDIKAKGINKETSQEVLTRIRRIYIEMQEKYQISP